MSLDALPRNHGGCGDSRGAATGGEAAEPVGRDAQAPDESDLEAEAGTAHADRAALLTAWAGYTASEVLDDPAKATRNVSAKFS